MQLTNDSKNIYGLKVLVCLLSELGFLTDILTTSR